MDYTFSQLDALRRAWDRTAGRVQNVALAEHEADMLDNLDLTYIDHYGNRRVTARGIAVLRAGSLS